MDPLVASQPTPASSKKPKSASLCANATTICCHICAANGGKYSRVFYGRRIDPVSHADLPMDHENLPNDPKSMTPEQCEDNARSLHAMKEHYRRMHKELRYQVSQPHSVATLRSSSLPHPIWAL